MPIDQKLTAVRNTPNKSARQNVPRKGVVLHHAAMTSLSGLRSLAMGAKQVSATNIVKDGENERLMSDEFRAWSLSSAWADSSFRSVETCNESTAGWTISDASHWTLARNVAYWADRDGFWPHRNGDPRTWTVLGHREVFTIYGQSYSTACPGGMDLDLVTRRAQQLLTGLAGGGVEIIMPFSQDDANLIWRTLLAANAGIAVSAQDRIVGIDDFLAGRYAVPGTSEGQPAVAFPTRIAGIDENTKALLEGQAELARVLAEKNPPVVKVTISAAALVDALKDPAVSSALAPAIAKATADEIDRRNNIKRG